MSVMVVKKPSINWNKPKRASAFGIHATDVV